MRIILEINIDEAHFAGTDDISAFAEELASAAEGAIHDRRRKLHSLNRNDGDIDAEISFRVVPDNSIQSLEPVSGPDLDQTIANGNKPVEIFIDGACSGNPGPGGWGIAIKAEKGFIEFSGSSAGDTTNNQMELTAAIQAIRIAPRNAELHIFADSEYVVKGISQWLSGWKKNGWRNSQNRPVANKELWQELDTLTNGRNIYWKWLRGHAGHEGNERADRIATSAIRRN